MRWRAPVWFVTGTDTGVGKTVLTAVTVRQWRAQQVRARAVKPLCSGGRDDARVLRAAQDDALGLDAVNPWHFEAALAPAMAARREGRPVRLREVLRFVQASRADCDVLLVEGAGGLLSPLGDDFDSRTLIARLEALPVVVAANRLGCLNQVLLTLEALGDAADRAMLVLMQPPRSNLVSVTNAEALRDRWGPERVVEFPWLGPRWRSRAEKDVAVVRAVDRLALRGGDSGP